MPDKLQTMDSLTRQAIVIVSPGFARTTVKEKRNSGSGTNISMLLLNVLKSGDKTHFSDDLRSRLGMLAAASAICKIVYFTSPSYENDCKIEAASEK